MKLPSKPLFKNWNQVECIVCGIKFETARPGARKYCSARCGSKHWRAVKQMEQVKERIKERKAERKVLVYLGGDES